MIVLTGVFFFAELFTGFITKSLSLQSDAFHMLSDEAGLIIGLIAHGLSQKKKTNRMTFGWSRAEVLGGFANSLFLLIISLNIFIEAISRFINPEDIQEVDLFIGVGILGFLVNLIGVFIFHNHNHSENIEAIYLHLFGDLLGSVGVLVSAYFVKFSSWNYRIYIDPMISIFIVGFLATHALRILKKTGIILLESTPTSIDISMLQQQVLSIESIEKIEKFHVWELSKGESVAMINVHITKGSNITDTHAAIKEILKEIESVCISVEENKED